MHEHESFFASPPNWVALAFIVFFVLFGKKLWTTIRDLLDGHAAAVRAELADAQRLRNEAEAMLADATTRRQNALAEAQKLIAGAQAEAQRLAAAAAADAETSAKRREQMALDRIAAAEKAAIDDVRRTAADLAAKAATQIIRETLTPAANATLVERAITALPTALRA